MIRGRKLTTHRVYAPDRGCKQSIAVRLIPIVFLLLKENNKKTTLCDLCVLCERKKITLCDLCASVRNKKIKMKNYPKNKLLLIAAIILVSTTWLQGTAHASLTVSAKSLLFKIQHKQNITLVDIRNRQEFEKVKIPGSINIPLYFIKTKPFLKNRSIVLINGGYPDTMLEKECLYLRQNNFKASVLQGGLLAWYKEKGPIEGDLLLLKDYRHISPAQFYREKDRKNRLIIDTSEKQNPESKNLIPETIHVPLIKLLTSLCLRGKQGSDIIIFNENGDNYDRIDRILNKAGCKNVFYLKGGLNACKTYLQNLTLAQKPKQSRTRSINRCRNCGREK